MIILPIQSLTEEDQAIFGANLLNLAKLKRVDFPIPPGLVISPPEIILDTVLKHIQDPKGDIFDQKLTIIKSEVSRIPLFKEFEQKLVNGKSFLVNGRLVKSRKEVWLKLLGIWLAQIRDKLWQQGFVEGLTFDLTPQAVFSVNKISQEITSYFDPQTEDVIISCSQTLNPTFLKQINQMVSSANKKLFLPQIYQFILSGKKLYLVGVTPFTQTLPVSSKEEIVLPQPAQKEAVKSAIKLFVNLSTGFSTQEVDGVLIEGEKMDGFDNVVFKLCDAALQNPLKPVIFKLPDVKENDKIRGTLRLLNQSNLLGSACDIFLFVRNKKNIFNIELAIPYIKSCDELLEIKRELASRGISRKGTLKLWMEVCTPENIINLEDYLMVGIDGVVLNLDALQENIGGYDFSEGEFYKKNILALTKFLTPAFKILHKGKIPVLATGSLILHPDVLDFLVEAGVYGIVVNTPLEADGMEEHLNWAEKRMVIKRLG